MPTIYDPGFYAGLIKTLGLRENFLSELPQGLLLTIDVGQLLSTPPPIPISNVGKGIFRVFNPANPGLGSDLSVSANNSTDINGVVGIGTGKRWQLVGMNLQLVTSATVANRQVGLQVKTPGAPGGTWTFGWDVTGVAASSNQGVVFGVGLAAANLTLTRAGVSNIVPIPPSIYLEANWALATNTINLQVGDQLSGIWIVMHEY